MAQSGCDIWEVLEGDGEARLLSLDALDAAYSRDEISERTRVRPYGETEWTTLGSLIGTTPGSFAEFDTQVVPVPLPSTRPLSIDLEEMDFDAVRPRRKARGVLVAGIATLLAGIAVLVGTTLHSSTPAAPEATAAIAPLRQSERPAPSTPPAAAESAAPNHVEPMAATPQSVGATVRTDASKVPASSKARPAKSKPNVKPPKHKAPAKKAHSPFHRGGNKFDPLSTGP